MTANIFEQQVEKTKKKKKANEKNFIYLCFIPSELLFFLTFINKIFKSIKHISKQKYLKSWKNRTEKKKPEDENDKKILVFIDMPLL